MAFFFLFWKLEQYGFSLEVRGAHTTCTSVRAQCWAVTSVRELPQIKGLFPLGVRSCISMRIRVMESEGTNVMPPQWDLLQRREALVEYEKINVYFSTGNLISPFDGSWETDMFEVLWSVDIFSWFVLDSYESSLFHTGLTHLQIWVVAETVQRSEMVLIDLFLNRVCL